MAATFAKMCETFLLLSLILNPVNEELLPKYLRSGWPFAQHLEVNAQVIDNHFLRPYQVEVNTPYFPSSSLLIEWRKKKKKPWLGEG